MRLVDYAMCAHSQAFLENIQFVEIASFLASSLMSLEWRKIFVLNFAFFEIFKV